VRSRSVAVNAVDGKIGTFLEGFHRRFPPRAKYTIDADPKIGEPSQRPPAAAGTTSPVAPVDRGLTWLGQHLPRQSEKIEISARVSQVAENKCELGHMIGAIIFCSGSLLGPRGWVTRP
jgi:hypothetical protein